MHSIKVILFSNLRIKVGERELRIDIDENSTIDDLLHKLVVMYPGIKPHLTDKIIISINHKIADKADPIPFDAEVALMPPAGGG